MLECAQISNNNQDNDHMKDIPHYNYLIYHDDAVVNVNNVRRKAGKPIFRNFSNFTEQDNSKQVSVALSVSAFGC